MPSTTADVIADGASDGELVSRREHERARALVSDGKLPEAIDLFQRLVARADEPQHRAALLNDLGVALAEGRDWDLARQAFEEALSLCPDWSVPRQNLVLLATSNVRRSTMALPKVDARTKIGILSLLFNWPSTGGGTVHTAETARFLARAGYHVRHWVIRYAGWPVGHVAEPVDWPIEFLDFDEATWQRERIQQRVRMAVDSFAPDHLIITDSWSFKPCLAEAVEGHSYFLRLAAQECLCPLSNVRLLADSHGDWRCCPRHQLATPHVCQACVRDRFGSSGALHRAERALAGFEREDYLPRLYQAFTEANGVLVVNPLIAEAVKPYARAVHVIPSGFDGARFPTAEEPLSVHDGCLRILFAGLVDEPMKGFAVLQAACARLWKERHDFRLVVTVDQVKCVEPFLECAGWQTQAALPKLISQCDIIACPTIAEEALGRTAVEGMGAGRPVIASRIGGLPFTILDEATGLLCEPGDTEDFARQLRRLLDDASLRREIGARGRRRFLEHYVWDAILPKYRELFGVGAPHFR